MGGCSVRGYLAEGNGQSPVPAGHHVVAREPRVPAGWHSYSSGAGSEAEDGRRMTEGCPGSKDDRGHCRCWWDCSPCCWCDAPACDGTDCDSTHEVAGVHSPAVDIGQAPAQAPRPVLAPPGPCPSPNRLGTAAMRQRTPATQPPGIIGGVLRVGPWGHSGPGSSGRSAGQSGGDLAGTGAWQFLESANYGALSPPPSAREARGARARDGGIP